MERYAIADAMLDLDVPPTGERLFGEDFDSAPPPPPEPEVIEPTFSAAELEAARDEGFESGRAAALAEAAAADHAAIREAVARIAEHLHDARDAAADVATRCAEAVARVLLDSLSVALPALCARHGDAELAAVMATLLPALAQEPAITVRVHPHHAAALGHEIERLDPDVAARCRVVGAAAMAPGDLQVAWRNGNATREVSKLWDQVAEALGATGLLDAEAAVQEEASIAG
jgi:flagellar assembly protein FliH